MANIIGTKPNDVLNGTTSNDIIINGLASDDTLIGGGGKDKFVYNFNNIYKSFGTDIITDFGGIGKGINPSAAVIAEVDTLKFEGDAFTVQNLLLNQNGSNLEITFQGSVANKVILQNFALENLDNLSKSTGATVNLGNILFDGQNSTTDSFDVFNANSTQSTIFRKNTVTFLNDLDNNVNGFDNSDDVINGQGGNDKIDGLSGNDLLRGGAGNNTLEGGAGNDTLNVDLSEGDNFLSGGNGNDSLFASGYTELVTYYYEGTYEAEARDYSAFGNNTLNGGAGDDYFNIDLSNGDNLLSGGDGNDTLSGLGNATTSSHPSGKGNNTLNGGAGDDYFNIDLSQGDNLLSGGDGNDTLSGAFGNNTLNGGNGNDTIYHNFDNIGGNEILIGGSGKDKFVCQFTYYRGSNPVTITDFSAIGKGSNPSAAVIAELDTLQFTGFEGLELTPKNLLLTQNGNNLEITFDGGGGAKVILQNFALENLDNLAQVGNIVFDGQTSTTDSFDVFDANSTQSTIFNKNTVTFLNDLENNVNGFENSDDVINGQGGNDKIDGLSGNDLLRGGVGNDTLIGGTGNDLLLDNFDSTGENLLFGGDGNDYLSISGSFDGSEYAGSYFYGYASGNNTLNGGAGDDTLFTQYSTGDNLLSGGDGNDLLFASKEITSVSSLTTSGNNTLNGGTGDDTLNVDDSKGDNLLSGDNGNDYLSASGFVYNLYQPDFITSGNNTLNGGTGDDTLNVDDSTGDNLLSGGDGNDTLTASAYSFELYRVSITSGNNTLNGGAGNDILNVDYSSSANFLDGGDGNDTLTASSASSNNTLYSGNGNDYLTGGKGNDSLYGEDGTDTFAFNSYNEGIDTIYDFNATNELIQVSAAGFGGGLSICSLSSSQFTIGASATTSNQRFIYDNITGGLYFDLDGSGGAYTQVKFAQLSVGLSLTKNNFVIV
ncbi:MAG: calcium-binding protein [Nostoc sp.]|uniref:beta strand repeat-containing protein n=1 Tax=Nostoc sp. TaxID=1180 RepID=UPI002FFCD71E